MNVKLKQEIKPDLYIVKRNSINRKRKIKPIVKQKLMGIILLIVSIIMTCMCFVSHDDMTVLLFTYGISVILLFSKKLIIYNR